MTTETTTTQPAKYKIEIIFNGLTYNRQSDDLNKAILELKPELLQTEMYITIKKGGQKWERKLNLIQGRKLFNDGLFREIFINNLI